MELIAKYINYLGFSGEFIITDFGQLFPYQTNSLDQVSSKSITIPFIFYKDEESLFNYHLAEWNRNELDYFIAVGNSASYILKAKEKPHKNAPLKKEVIVGEKVNIGINTVGYGDVNSSDIPFSKENIDNSIFFDFVLRKQKEIKNEVDTHLLNNLIALKFELSKFDSNTDNINGLILKCLFIKYLEDRNIISNFSFVEVLKSKNPEELQNTFEKISIINGDILKMEIEILPNHIEHLVNFFTQDYKPFIETGQQSLFYPYRFDKIPIQLISNIYEEFLGTTNKDDKKSKGIFYTRTFVVDFMLSHSIYPRLEKEPYATVLDPACGSGAFLVQAFKHILNNPQNQNLTIDEKANLLKKQVFGIDIDESALQITAFSLYLTLLEGISKEAIQDQIIRKNPILPSLIGSNLQKKNAIADEIEFNIEVEENGKKESFVIRKFDCIAANPPWRELKADDANKDPEIKKTRQTIDSSDIYNNVYKYQTSQAFLLRINTLCKQNTDIAIIVNNSNFLNEGAVNFRNEILNTFCFNYFYELSDVSSILFKHTEHPCAVLILNKQNSNNHKIKYITPRLTEFNKKLRVISYSSKDVKEINQKDLKTEDILWRIFVNGNWEDYQLIKRIEFKRDEEILVRFCGRGINPNNATPREGEPIIKKLIEANQLERFNIKKLEDININQDFERERVEKEELFNGSRILVKRIPTPKDELKLATVFIDTERYFKEQIIALKLNKPDLHKAYASLLNSSLIGFYLNHISAQTNKGKKLPSIRHNELKELPLINISRNSIDQLTLMYDKIQSIKEANGVSTDVEYELDELVFDLYNLLEFEKEIIREFYQVSVERKNDTVNSTDIQNFVDKFRKAFQLVMKKDLRLNALYIRSSNIGTIIKFNIVDKAKFIEEVKSGNFEQRKILQLIKEKQIEKEMFNGYINEEKVKIFDERSFYIIKSNQFKDWTERQAVEDANEEVHELINKLQ